MPKKPYDWQTPVTANLHAILSEKLLQLQRKLDKAIKAGDIGKAVAIADEIGYARGQHDQQVADLQDRWEALGVQKSQMARTKKSTEAVERRKEIIQAIASKLIKNGKNTVTHAAQLVAEDNLGRFGWSYGVIKRVVAGMTKGQIIQDGRRTLSVYK